MLVENGRGSDKPKLRAVVRPGEVVCGAIGELVHLQLIRVRGAHGKSVSYQHE